MYYDEKKTGRILKADILLNGVLNRLQSGLPDGSHFERLGDYVSHDFLPGSDGFISGPAANARWSLGYASRSLVPPDWKEKDYYLGGYFVAPNRFNNRIEDIIDDMRVRCIAIDDGSGRGMSIFAVADCIGISNADIRFIRGEFLHSYRAAHPGAKFASVNVLSTHTHSCVDTEGLWTGGIGKIFRNLRLAKKGKTPERGTDAEYMDFLTGRVVSAMTEAAEGLAPGKLTLAQKDIGDRYFGNRNRPSASALDTRLTRLLFTPDDRDIRPTVIMSIAAHPDCAGLATSDGSGTGRELSGDYIYYLGDALGREGYNLLFFNGSVCAIYMAREPSNDGLPMPKRYMQSERYGRELARLVLAMTKTKEEISADPFLSDSANIKRDTALAAEGGGGYTLWYESHEPCAETEVEPVLNIRLAEVDIRCTNPIILLAGKLDLTGFKVLTEGDDYYIRTEIGYMELGKDLRIVMVPGEYCCDLLKGGSSLSAEGSFSGKDYGLPTLWDLFGEGTVAMGLANDAIGYIVPDNDYVLGDFGNHYHETLSLGEHTGSTVTKAFMKLSKELPRQ